MGSVGTSHARDATVVVDVVEGRRGASGVDESAKKHERLLGRLGGVRPAQCWLPLHVLQTCTVPPSPLLSAPTPAAAAAPVGPVPAPSAARSSYALSMCVTTSYEW